MLIGVGLLLFGISRARWQERSSFGVVAAGIVLVLPDKIIGRRS